MSLQALQVDLPVDRVISAGRAYRHYGVTLAQVRRAGIPALSRPVRRTTGARAVHAITFLVASPRLRSARDWQLRHLAVATAARLDQGASTSEWRNHAGRGRAPLVPDAEWAKPGSPLGVWAIEIDTGSYSRATIRRKANVFALTFGMQIWVVSSERPSRRGGRVATVETVLRDLGHPAVTVATRWW